MIMKIYIEYDNNKLASISNELYKLFNKNYETVLLGNNLSNTEKINIIKNNKNSFTISNKINDNNSIEIIYPLRKTNVLARELYNNLESYNVSKYYQLRDNTNTNLDFYELLRDINNNSIVIKYGNDYLNNLTIPNIIYKTINSYLGNENIYIVKSGDSLYSIAKKFNTTVDDIKKINNLTNNLLSINQKLIIPQDNNSNDNNNNDIYIVKSGDSLYSIAKKFNTTIDDIKKTNNLTNNLLSINQRLIIPKTSTITYTVIKGDSLYSIAKKFNTTVDNIKKANNLNSNLLSIGQKLIIN